MNLRDIIVYCKINAHFEFDARNMIHKYWD